MKSKKEDLLKEWISHLIKEESAVLPGFTVGGQVVDLPQQGNEFGVIPGRELSKEEELDMKRLSSQAFSDFAASRTGVGDVFEDIVANLYDGVQLNLPDGADFPFADIRIGDEYYSVKASKDETRSSGAAASPIKIATLITMIDKFGKDGKMKAGVLMTFKGSKEGNISKFTMKKSETVTLEIVKEDDVSDKVNYAALLIGGESGPVWFSIPKKGGSWKPVDPKDPAFQPGGDLEDADLKMGPPIPVSATGAVGAGDRWNNPDQLSNVFGQFSDEKSIYLYNDQGEDARADLRRGDVDLGDGNISQGSSDVRLGVARRAEQQKQRVDYRLKIAKQEYRRAKRSGDAGQLAAAKEELSAARQAWDDLEEEIIENTLRKLVSSLLNEELTKTDKREIERIAKKQAKAIVASELETALGASFFGTKGKVNKFVSDEIDKRFSKGRRDPHFADTVETICKEILKKFHRDMALKYPQMVDRIKIR